MKNTSYAASRSSARERPSTPPKGHSTNSAAAAAAADPRLRASSSVAVVSEERAKDEADRERWWCWRRPMSSSPADRAAAAAGSLGPRERRGARHKGGGAETARGADLAGGWHMAVAARRAAVPGDHDSWVRRLFGTDSSSYGLHRQDSPEEKAVQEQSTTCSPAGCRSPSSVWSVLVGLIMGSNIFQKKKLMGSNSQVGRIQLRPSSLSCSISMFP